MTRSHDPMVCADLEGLICLSDLAEIAEPETLPSCTSEDPCLHFFQGMGFRPAAWTMHRDQYGDHPMLIISGDDVYLSKYDLPVILSGFMPEGLIPALPGPVGTPVLLAVPTPGTTPSYGFGGIGFPGFFGGSGGSGGAGGIGRPGQETLPDVGNPSGPGTTPGTGTGRPDIILPPLAPVPLSGSGLFLIMALAGLMISVTRKKMSDRT